jgi:hypothetical protein
MSIAAMPSRNLGWRMVVSGHAKIFRRQHVAEADEGNVLGNLQALREEGFRAADGHEVVDGLDGGGIAGFIEHLQRGLGAVFDRAAGLKHELVVHVQIGLAQGAAVAFKAVVRPRRDDCGPVR